MFLRHVDLNARLITWIVPQPGITQVLPDRNNLLNMQLAAGSPTVGEVATGGRVYQYVDLATTDYYQINSDIDLIQFLPTEKFTILFTASNATTQNIAVSKQLNTTPFSGWNVFFNAGNMRFICGTDISTSLLDVTVGGLNFTGTAPKQLIISYGGNGASSTKIWADGVAQTFSTNQDNWTSGEAGPGAPIQINGRSGGNLTSAYRFYEFMVFEGTVTDADAAWLYRNSLSSYYDLLDDWRPGTIDYWVNSAIFTRATEKTTPDKLITITNISDQVVRISYNSISLDLVNSASEVTYSKSGNLILLSGGSVKIEQSRVRLTQLGQLAKLGLIRYD